MGMSTFLPNMAETSLIERTTRSVSTDGQMRLVADHWRDVFEKDREVEYDLVETEDGTHEIRIRRK